MPVRLLPRVSTYDHLESIALAPLGIVAFALMYETLGHQSSLALAATLAIVPTLLVFAERDVRRITIDCKERAADQNKVGYQRRSLAY